MTGSKSRDSGDLFFYISHFKAYTRQVFYFLDKYIYMREKIIQNTNLTLKKKTESCKIDLVHNFLVFTLGKKTMRKRFINLTIPFIKVPTDTSSSSHVQPSNLTAIWITPRIWNLPRWVLDTLLKMHSCIIAHYGFHKIWDTVEQETPASII